MRLSMYNNDRLTHPKLILWKEGVSDRSAFLDNFSDLFRVPKDLVIDSMCLGKIYSLRRSFSARFSAKRHHNPTEFAFLTRS